MNKPYVVLSVDFGTVFCQLDESEKVFLVQLMRLLNEVNILTKAVLFTTRGITEARGPIQTAQRVTGLFFLRELAGKLWEGWQLFQKSYFKAGLSKRYEQKLGPTANQILTRIKQYFGEPANPLKLIRDKHAFHYDASVVKSELAQRCQSEPLPAFVAEDRGNCLFVFADDLATQSVLREFDRDEQAAMKKLIEEIAIKVPGWFQEFGQEMLMGLAGGSQPRAEEHQIDGVPTLDEVGLPFFVRRNP